MARERARDAERGRRALLKLDARGLRQLYGDLWEEWVHCGRPPHGAMNRAWRLEASLLQVELDRRGTQLSLF